MEVVDVLDERGKAIGQSRRDRVHQKGLLHREVHVWLYTPKGELIWQVRSATKETFAGFLDATVGGHVGSGQSVIDAAVRETEEEIGIHVEPKKLKFIDEIRANAYDPTTNLTNNVLRTVYALPFGGG